MPPALSATGPYASVARVRPKVDSRPVDAIATPNGPASDRHERRTAAMIRVGVIIDIIPTLKPYE